MGWLFNIQSAQCYFAVGALLKTDKLCEIELVQNTELGSAWQSLHGFKLFLPVLSCIQHAWLVQKSGVIFSLNFITRLRFWAPRFSFVCIGEGLVCLSKCVWDAPDKVHRVILWTQICLYCWQKILWMLSARILLGKWGVGECVTGADLTSSVSRKGENKSTKCGASNCQDQYSSMTCKGIQMGNRHPNRPFGWNNSEE